MSGASAGSGAEAALAELDAALDRLAALDLDTVAVAALGPVLERLTRAQRRLDAQAVRVVGRFDAAGAFTLDGAASASAWLRANTRVTPGAARAGVRLARRITRLPAMSDAFTAGEIGREHAAVVTTAMARNPQREATITAAEPSFAVAATKLDPAQLASVVARWTHAVDPLGAVEAERAVHAQRFLSCSRTFEGAVAINGLLAPEAGAVVMTALEAASTAAYRTGRTERAEGATSGDGTNATDDTEGSTPGQRRADALVELSRRFLDSGAAPEVMGVRPHLQVVITADALLAETGQAGLEPAHLEGVGPVSAEAARRIGCDAVRSALIRSAAGMPLSYGRTQRVVPPGLRKVLVVRDGGCRFPGCGRPVSWCQAHHIVHWAHGGQTSAENLVLTCSHHHHVVHEGGFTIRGSPQTGTLSFHRPDGSVVVDRARAA